LFPFEAAILSKSGDFERVFRSALHSDRSPASCSAHVAGRSLVEACSGPWSSSAFAVRGFTSDLGGFSAELFVVADEDAGRCAGASNTSSPTCAVPPQSAACLRSRERDIGSLALVAVAFR
jgi:hypothetical protein